jgi:hypothetical protein
MTTLDDAVFDYLKPSDEQQSIMAVCREAACDYAEILDRRVPDGPDKTYLLRKLREVAMWANVAITRNADGSPRAD